MQVKAQIARPTLGEVVPGRQHLPRRRGGLGGGGRGGQGRTQHRRRQDVRGLRVRHARPGRSAGGFGAMIGRRRPPGPAALVVRATDGAGATQPVARDPDRRTYLINHPCRSMSSSGSPLPALPWRPSWSGSLWSSPPPAVAGPASAADREKVTAAIEKAAEFLRKSATAPGRSRPATPQAPKPGSGRSAEGSLEAFSAGYRPRASSRSIARGDTLLLHPREKSEGLTRQDTNAGGERREEEAGNFRLDWGKGVAVPGIRPTSFTSAPFSQRRGGMTGRPTRRPGPWIGNDDQPRRDRRAAPGRLSLSSRAGRLSLRGLSDNYRPRPRAGPRGVGGSRHHRPVPLASVVATLSMIPVDGGPA